MDPVKYPSVVRGRYIGDRGTPSEAEIVCCSSSPLGQTCFWYILGQIYGPRRPRGPIWNDLLRLNLPKGRPMGPLGSVRATSAPKGGGAPQGAVLSGSPFRSLLTSSGPPFVNSVREWNWHRSGASFGSSPRRHRTGRSAPEQVKYRVNSMSPISRLGRSGDTPGETKDLPRPAIVGARCAEKEQGPTYKSRNTEVQATTSLALNAQRRWPLTQNGRT